MGLDGRVGGGGGEGGDDVEIPVGKERDGWVEVGVGRGDEERWVGEIPLDKAG